MTVTRDPDAMGATFDFDVEIESREGETFTVDGWAELIEPTIRGYNGQNRECQRIRLLDGTVVVCHPDVDAERASRSVTRINARGGISSSRR